MVRGKMGEDVNVWKEHFSVLIQELKNLTFSQLLFSHIT